MGFRARAPGAPLVPVLLLLLLPTAVRTQPIQEEIPVFAALELLASPGVDARSGAEGRLAHLLVGLEAAGPVRVREHDILLAAPLGVTGPGDARSELRMRALREGARYVVVFGETRLAGRVSFDVQILGVGKGPVFARFTGRDPEQVAGRARDWLVRLAHGHGTRSAQILNGGASREPPEPRPEPEDLRAALEVIEIRIEGNRRIDADAIRSVLRTRVGEVLSQDSVARDIRRIYELGFFRDVKVLATDLRAGKLVTFQVEENPVIRRVTITGNESMGSEDITEQLTLTIGSTVDYPLLLENEARIEAIYQARGYYQAEVDYRIEPMGPEAVSIDFDVAEGPKLRLRRIRFDGNESLDDGELLSDLQTKPWGFFSPISKFWDNSGLYTEPLFYQDLDSITRKYMDRGFIRVKIGDPEVIFDDEGLEVLVSIEEGPQYTIGTVDVLGDESMNHEELLDLIQMRPEAVFSRSELSDDVERLRSRYADRGFYAARVRPRTDVDPDALTVDVLFEVEKNELFFVDWIKVAGNTRTRDTVVRRELGLAEGELYSDRALERSRARVRRLGFFEEVSLETQQLDDGTLGVTVDVVERPTGSFSFGAGVGSADGFLLNGSIRQDNLFGRGWAVNASADVGSDSQFASLRFNNPAFMNTAMGLGTSLSFSDFEFDDFSQEVTSLHLDVSYPLDEGETTGTLGYGFSSREVTGFSEFQASSLLQREEYQGKTTTSLLTLAARYDTRDDIRFPRDGQVSGVALEFAGLGGLSKFVRMEGRTSWFLPAKRWTGFESTFVVNSRLGYVVPLNSISDFDLPGCESTTCVADLLPNHQPLTNIDTDLELPLTERYFLGGVGPFQVRGFEQRSLGPRRSALIATSDPTLDEVLFTTSGNVFNPGPPATLTCMNPAGCNELTDSDIDDFENLELTDVIGGDKMFLLNLELQFPISEDLGLMGIIFFDMGNAFGEDESISPADLRLGAGFGAQWFSPFGPILVQLGFPLDPLEDEDGSVFEFSLGGQRF